MKKLNKKPDIEKGIKTGKKVWDIMKETNVPLWVKIGITIGGLIAGLFLSFDAVSQNNYNGKRIWLDTLRARPAQGPNGENTGGTNNFNMPYSWGDTSSPKWSSNMYVNDTLLTDWLTVHYTDTVNIIAGTGILVIGGDTISVDNTVVPFWSDTVSILATKSDLPSQPANQIVRGSGTGLTSSAGFTYDGTNAIGNTGSFTWDNVRLNGQTISTVSGDLSLQAAGPNIIMNDNIYPSLTNAYTLGSATNRWGTGYMNALALGTGGADQSTLSGTFTAARTVTMPNKSGTIAFLDDIPTGITNLEDYGPNVINSASGTGYFGWKQIRLNDNTVSTQAGALILDAGSGSIVMADSNFPSPGNTLTSGGPANNWSYVYSNNISLGNHSTNRSVLTGTYTAARTATLPDKSGTLAFLDDIPSIAQPANQIVRGSGTGLTSSAGFTYDGTNAVGNTGYFQWDLININSNIIKSNSQVLVLDSDLSIWVTQSIIPEGVTANLGEEADPFITGYFNNIVANNQMEVRNGSDQTIITTNSTGNNTATFQDSSGTIAWLSDIKTSVTGCGVSEKMYIETFELGACDMESVSNIAISHNMGSDWIKTRDVSVKIINDTADTIFEFITGEYPTNIPGGFYRITSTQILLNRIESGTFDSDAFDDGTLNNRGYVTITWCGLIP